MSSIFPAFCKNSITDRDNFVTRDNYEMLLWHLIKSAVTTTKKHHKLFVEKIIQILSR